MTERHITRHAVRPPRPPAADSFHDARVFQSTATPSAVDTGVPLGARLPAVAQLSPSQTGGEKCHDNCPIGRRRLQREAAERAAGSAPGITRVDNRITIVPTFVLEDMPES